MKGDYDDTSGGRGTPFIRIVTVVSLLFFAHSTDAAEVSDWAGLNGVTENISFTGDITAEGLPKTINSGTDVQIVDGGGFSLMGASGYSIKKRRGRSLRLKISVPLRPEHPKITITLMMMRAKPFIKK